ncbi:DUF465 domain-containing protein [bacterium]|jgi:hypothetical protein|nr:DUF465 domain-containing protein [bacterium]|tara:strand:+ start:1829 stop:2044 length:216 start_codon:yes stop_codon:yes gene_type:complete
MVGILSTVNSLSNHLTHLEEMHRALDEKITRHYDRHDSDDAVKIEKLEKLSLKKEIEHLRNKIKEMQHGDK